MCGLGAVSAKCTALVPGVKGYGYASARVVSLVSMVSALGEFGGVNRTQHAQPYSAYLAILRSILLIVCAGATGT